MMNMSKLLSPLRYPGGKAKLYPVIKYIIENNTDNVDTYIEPFAGGAGIALNLLFDNVVKKIVINDYDKAIYSIWRAILTETNSFINLLKETPLDIQEWKNQKRIYSENNKRYSLEYGFSAFYLNRTNRSGIIKAGPIGGLAQDGKYKIDARYNKEELINRILEIVTQKDKIKLYNKECSSFIKNVLPKYEKTGFIYFDPPYYDKGKELYKNFFESNDHLLLAQNIKNNVNCDWVITYDSVKEISNMYAGYLQKQFSLNYSAGKAHKGNELIIFKDASMSYLTKDLKERYSLVDVQEDKNDN